MSADGETREVICTACPRGCPLQVRVLLETVQVEGATCRRGVAFGEAEVRDPRRVLTTTVRVVGGTVPLAPVRSRTPISRALIPKALSELRAVAISAPVGLHQVVLAAVAGTDVDIVTTGSVAAQQAREGSH